MTNNVPYTLIDTAGQTTAVIDVPISRSKQPIVAKPLMKQIPNIGQVCFVEGSRLQMMGNEFSVNGTLAGGYYLLNKFKSESLEITASGLKGIFKATKNGVYFPRSMIINCTENFVDFGGICYRFFPENYKKEISSNTRELLMLFAKNRPAAGIVYYQQNKIRPLIFVRSTNTIIWETCCGSASIAYAVISKKRIIQQPSRQNVHVEITNKDVICSARCGVLR